MRTRSSWRAPSNAVSPLVLLFTCTTSANASRPTSRPMIAPAHDRRRRAATGASTVLEAIEELRNAGAEAMQIADLTGSAVRIVASTYFVDVSNGISVDGHTLTGRYTITVIGPADTMHTALTIPGGVADAVERDGGNVGVDEPGEVTVDALRPAQDLQYAKPAE